MASAEVLSNLAVSSRKQALEAGKSRALVMQLDKFRKKKVAKAAASSQSRGADSAVHEKQALENRQVQLSNSAGADAGTRIDPVAQASGFLDHNDKSYGLAHASAPESVALTQVDFQSYNVRPHVFLRMQTKQEGDDPIGLGLNDKQVLFFNRLRKTEMGALRLILRRKYMMLQIHLPDALLLDMIVARTFTLPSMEVTNLSLLKIIVLKVSQV